MKKYITIGISIVFVLLCECCIGKSARHTWVVDKGEGEVDSVPQLQAFKVRGDEEFRLSIYPQGTALKGKPQTVMSGYVDIGGSANMMDYVFKNRNIEFEFGDSFYEEGKQFLMIKKEGKETQHEIESCYWLDLIKG